MPKHPSINVNNKNIKKQKMNSTNNDENLFKFTFTPTEFLRNKIHLGDKNV